jgi:tetratricopeptide (TPR) repeat protein
VIQDRAILKVLETIIANPPEQLYLVLITREDPLLPVSRLRGNHQMTEIRAGDLRFSEREGGHLVPEMLAVGGLAGIAIQQGQLHFGHEAGSQALERLEREGAIYSPMAGAVHATLGLICYEWNQLDNANSYLLQSIQLSNLSGHNAVVVYAKVILGRVFQAQGDARSAGRTIQEAIDLLPFGLPAWIKPDIALLLVRFYLDQGNPANAETVVKQQRNLQQAECQQPHSGHRGGAQAYPSLVRGKFHIFFPRNPHLDVGRACWVSVKIGSRLMRSKRRRIMGVKIFAAGFSGDVRTYKIQIHGRVEEADIHASSPLPFAIEQIEGNNTTITLQTDQSGIIGMIRHLHGLGLTLISISCAMENLPDSLSKTFNDR